MLTLSQKVEFSVVKEKMLKESKNPLLVYATEDALNTPRIPLSDELQRFVLAENKIFRQELSHEADQDDDEDVPLINPNISPVSPSKRKYRANSVDSMDTNRASLGNSETNSRAGDFDDMDAFGMVSGGVVRHAANTTSSAAQSGRYSDLEGLRNQSQDQLSATLSPESTHSAASQNTAPALFSRSSTSQTLQETVDTGSIDQPIELEATNNEIKLPEMQERGGNGSLFGSRHASASSASGRRDAAAEAMDVDASFSRQLD